MKPVRRVFWAKEQRPLKIVCMGVEKWIPVSHQPMNTSRKGLANSLELLALSLGGRTQKQLSFELLSYEECVSMQNTDRFGIYLNPAPPLYLQPNTKFNRNISSIIQTDTVFLVYFQFIRVFQAVPYNLQYISFIYSLCNDAVNSSGYEFEC
jgi:hypothetical protein